MPPNITDVPGLLVGHTTNRKAETGCTVVLAPPGGMRAAAFVRGRASGTRELDALSPRHLVSNIHAILLTGGSAFGLGAADGVMRWLAEKGRGFDVGVGVVPVVPSAVVFDLAFGRPEWPDAADGFSACEDATQQVVEGSVGAGTGATVGKVLGVQGAMKGGVGSWSERSGELVVGVLAIVNAFGDVRGADGEILAGARGPDGFVDARRFLKEGGEPGGAFARPGANTTLVVVATNAKVSRVGLSSLAEMAADALAQRITPVGTLYDGDIVFAASVGEELMPSTPLMVELLAQGVCARAVERAVLQATKLEPQPHLGE